MWGFGRFCDLAIDEYRRLIEQGESGLPDELEEDFFRYATTHSLLGYARYWLERQHGLDVDGFSKQVVLVSHPELLVGHEGDHSNGRRPCRARVAPLSCPGRVLVAHAPHPHRTRVAHAPHPHRTRVAQKGFRCPENGRMYDSPCPCTGN